EAWLEALVSYLQNNRNYLISFFNDNLLNLSVIKPEGTFLAWIDFRKTGLSDEELQSVIVNKAGLALSPGIMYGTAGSGFMRLNFGLPRSVLEQACARLYDTLKQG
ncbi:MAG: aminotransferase class I/II-fold pyridoxal phosphate-dependent enzyme, partial [Candidatus Cloacimonadaceae bacterium]